MRRIMTITLPIVLAVAAFWGTYGLLQSPRYALYQIGKALKDGDSAIFLAYVDVPRIIANQRPAAADARANEAEENLRRAIQGVMDVVVGANPQAFHAQMAQIMSQLETDRLPSPFLIAYAASIQQNGDRALVVLSDPQSGDRLRLGMLRQNDQWRVVHVDQRDVRDLLRKYAAQTAS